VNAEYLYIVKQFLPEIVLIVGALLVLGIDLVLSARNDRRGTVLAAALVALLAAGVAGWQWRNADITNPAFVRAVVQNMMQADGRGTATEAQLSSPRFAQAEVIFFKEAQHDAVVAVVDNYTNAAQTQMSAEAGKIAREVADSERDRAHYKLYDASLRSPGFAVWWFFSHEPYTLAFKFIFALAAALALLLAARFPVERYRAEFGALLLFAASGLMVMVSTQDLVIVFLGLELASLCFYAMAAWQKGDARSAEAGTKYLLLGSLASAIFIYGASLLFVQFGSTHLALLGAVSRGAVGPLTMAAVLMLLVAFGFKVAGAPFHLWAPDVYQGAPTTLVAFLSTASKAAGFGVLIRVLITLMNGGMLQSSARWFVVIGLMSALSILVGNTVAIHQNNVKRLLAYSGIAQAGYILIGVLAMGLAQHSLAAQPELGVQAVIFYLFLYMLTNIGAFGVVGIVGQETGSEEMSAFAGLRERAPLLAFGMTVLLLSLGGIPMLSGFMGKWFLFLAGVQEGQYLLVALGAVMSVVSMYYYLLVVKQMYILPAAKEAKPIRVGALAGLTLTAVILLTVIIGLYPSPFLHAANHAAAALLLR
jgi:NADH-quinone oxidoreductase subunit N